MYHHPYIQAAWYKWIKALFLILPIFSFGQEDGSLPWHGIERVQHYKPDGKDFTLVNGSRRFNRALYGSNSGFRVEAGDLPEFALYLPGMGGNLKFGLIKNGQDKWLINASRIETKYRPGSMLYTIRDKMLGNGSLQITVLPRYDSEGLLVKMETKNIPADVQLVTVFGGVTGRRFSRDGDIGADPESSFYLQPEYCRENVYQLNKNSFRVFYGSRNPLTEEEKNRLKQSQIESDKKATDLKFLSGIFPPSADLKTGDALQQNNPAQLLSSVESSQPLMTAILDLNQAVLYFYIQPNETGKDVSYKTLPELFEKAERQRKAIAGRVQINTPDPYINTLGGALSIAADAIWESPSFMHGAVAWRMRLNGWRGAYAADVLGWHERAREHLTSYARSQLTAPLAGPVVMDTALNLARGLEKLGTSLFSSGYISRNPNGDFRAHHYDMNLVFIDQLLNHFQWTGDTAFVRKMWPLLQRHLAWEKRNFDADGDGLYDAYAAIWASDALQYSGGGVAHSSAYNYRANKMAAELAVLIGEDSSAYHAESEKILQAINKILWMKDPGWYAEYKDLLGNKLLHPAAGLWTVYHLVDSKVPDSFQAWQTLQYINDHIPRIPIRVKDLDDSSLYTLSTTTWQPYTWSLNNVVLAELFHTSLAYWQSGRNEEAFRLWKSSLVESMYLGASPGNIQQLSFYDAIRGELYRDFADPIGMAARSLVEGLFGIMPDGLNRKLFIYPGFPSSWDHASIHTPDVDFSFKRNGKTDRYLLTPNFPVKNLKPEFSIEARMDGVEQILVNNKPVKWIKQKDPVGKPVLTFLLPADIKYEIIIKWNGKSFPASSIEKKLRAGEILKLDFPGSIISDVYDPLQLFDTIKRTGHQVKAWVKKEKTGGSFFVKLQQGAFSYWNPVVIKVLPSFQIVKSEMNRLEISNKGINSFKGNLVINHSSIQKLEIPLKGERVISTGSDGLLSGTNSIELEQEGRKFSEDLIDWEISNPSSTRYEKVDLSGYFNDDVKNIFLNHYLSPRPSVTTLQLPVQGIGNWAYPMATAEVNDSGLRNRAGINNVIQIKQGIPFSTPSSPGNKNIVFTSMWNNYPDSVLIPLNGKSRHAYLLMAGSTNPMQSRLVNAEIIINYSDGSSQTLELKNPGNWWPIEQDYYVDGFAFTTGAPFPVRVHLKTGIDTRQFNSYTSIRGFSNRAIDGGSATVIDLPLDPRKTLKNLLLKTIANDVVIGLMSLTLVRP